MRHAVVAKCVPPTTEFAAILAAVSDQIRFLTDPDQNFQVIQDSDLVPDLGQNQALLTKSKSIIQF